MSGKRAPAPPPQLPGFTYVDVLGSGGFADVYLFEQHLPRRRVAVKVLLPDRMAGSSVEQFAAEANVMALLSTHPAIVTIYQAGMSEDGRPYLVMEYCSRPNLQVRSRAGAFSIAEALRVGVQVAAAAETAHRAGILHRDIKPANILVTEYNRPALTDFGIATTADSTASSGGMSIPWSPPEAFSDDPDSGVATDVYALGATVYTLLAGHSPFEQPGGRNGGADLIERIEGQPLPRLERTDAPVSLQLALERSMAKRPGDRFESAVAFARALQRVQIELSHSVTPIDILDDSPLADDEEDADGELTRVRGIVSIEPQTHPAAGQTRRRTDQVPSFTDAATTSPPTTPGAEETVLRPTPVAFPPADTTSSTIRRARPLPVPGDVPEESAVSTAASAPPARRAPWVWLAVAAAALVVVGVVVAGTLAGGASERSTQSPSTTARPQDPVGGIVPAPVDLAGTASGDTATFTWTNPDPQDGDIYIWYPYTLAGNGAADSLDAPTVSLPADPSGTTCIAVQIVREDGTGGDERRGCTP